jgi:hypothetical protein
VIRSRDRKGADAAHAINPRETRTRTLLRPALHHILDGRRDVHWWRDWFPQPSCADMARPSLPVRFIQPHPIQTAAGIRFEIAHHALWRNLRFHYSMHMIAAHVGCQQRLYGSTPATMPTHLLNRFQYRVAPHLVQVTGGLIHTFPRGCGARRIHIRNRRSRHVLFAVDGTGFTSVQVASIAGKGDQVNHGP